MVDGQQNKIRIGAIVQARMESKRLPGKVLKPLPFPGGKPLLEWVIDGAKQVTRINQVVLATSINPADDQLETFAKQKSLPVFRGSEDDVHSRFIKVIEEYDFDIVVRLTGDNPFLDSTLLDQAIAKHISNDNDYSRTVDLPLGMNFEIIKAEALLKTKNATLTAADREHVVLYIRNHEAFSKEDLYMLREEEWNNVRLTVDYPSDFAAASMILQHITHGERADLNFLRRIRKSMPWLFDINAGNMQQRQNLSLAEELTIALKMTQSAGLPRVTDILKTYVKA